MGMDASRILNVLMLALLGVAGAGRGALASTTTPDAGDGARARESATAAPSEPLTGHTHPQDAPAPTLDAPADAIWLFQIDRPAAETSGDLWPLQPQGLVITDEAYGPLSKPAPALQIPRPEPAGSSKSLALPGTLPGALPGAGPLPAKAPRRAVNFLAISANLPR